MAKYLYNDVELPELPDIDESYYPYAIIGYGDKSSGTNPKVFFLRLKNTGNLQNDGVSVVVPVFKPQTVAYQYDSESNSWIDYTPIYSFDYGVSGVVIWSNYDIYNKDGNQLLFPASDPVPVGGEPETPETPTKDLYYSRGGVWQRVYGKTPEGWKPVDIVMGVPDVVETFNQLDGARFIYFTDPHLSEGLSWEPDFHKYMAKVKQAFDASGCELVICGGDWIGNSDTKEQAIAKLTYIKSYMGKLFGGKALMVLGNHDTNYQGTEQLTQAELNEVWFKNTNTGKAYYYADTDTTRFLVLDTQLDWHPEWSTYFQEQYNWLTKNVSTTLKNVVVAHIDWLDETYTTRTALVDAVRLVEGVDLILSGHMHEDYMLTGQPAEVATVNMQAGNTPTFDLCALTDTQLTMLRVGYGSDRVINIGGAT